MKYIFLIFFVVLLLNISCTKNKKVNVEEYEIKNEEIEQNNKENNIDEKGIINLNNDIPITDFRDTVNTIKLEHEQFKTNNIWNKEICSPILDTELKIRFRTIINNAAFMEPNFDGKYKIVIYGAGTGTIGYFILDLNTGNVYESNSYSYFGMDYSVNSSLLIINPPTEVINYWGNESIPEWVQVEYLIITNGELKLILLIDSNGKAYH